MLFLDIIQAVCSILSLVISIFVINKVYKIDQKINVSVSKNKAMTQSVKGNSNRLKGSQ